MKTRTDALESSAPVSLGGEIILPQHISIHNLLPRPFQKLAIPLTGWRVWPKTRGTLLPKNSGTLSGEY